MASLVQEKRTFVSVRFVVYAVLVIGIVVFACYEYRIPLQERYEDFAYLINPTADRAFAYGERHFSAPDVQEYDINRAKTFFLLAVRSNPELPYIHHELARIYFLKGNYQSALAEINIQISAQGDNVSSSYYVRGLIEGFMGNYPASIKDYAHYIKIDPYDWAAINDYAWVLLKYNRPVDALTITNIAVTYFPNNPWILNTNATARYETGDIAGARIKIEAAQNALQTLTQATWLRAYPGNDPAIAQAGINSFKKSVQNNMHTIETMSTSTSQN